MFLRLQQVMLSHTMFFEKHVGVKFYGVSIVKNGFILIVWMLRCLLKYRKKQKMLNAVCVILTLLS